MKAMVVEITPEQANKLLEEFGVMGISLADARDLVQRYIDDTAKDEWQIRNEPLVMANAPTPQRPASGTGMPSYQQIRQAAQAARGLTPRAALRQEAYSYKTHFLLGRRVSDGATITIARWDCLPTKEQIDKATAGAKNDYVSYALTNPVNVWDAE